ncbi:MAG: hypothetical protein Q7S40_31410 [Opitutaceae bacterium]|nr:hypothetical protein [Opitutaceae bacterium]
MRSQITTPQEPEKKKASVWKVVGYYCLAWLIVAGSFVAFVMFAPNYGGFVQATADFVAMLAGLAFIPGLILVLAIKGGIHLFPREHKQKSYYDEISK